MRGLGAVIVFGVVNTLVSSTNGYNYEEQALRLHNVFRSKHSAPALELDAELSKRALYCADFYAGKKNVDWSCTESKGVGQNVFMAMGDYTMDQLVDLCVNTWYEGEKKYDYNTGEFTTNSGGFTQVVWKATTKLGFACHLNREYSVCLGFYSPPGNLMGHFHENVSKS